MFCIDAGRHELRTLTYHHGEKFFAALINRRNLVQIDDAIPRGMVIGSRSPKRDQLGDRVLR